MSEKIDFTAPVLGMATHAVSPVLGEFCESNESNPRPRRPYVGFVIIHEDPGTGLKCHWCALLDKHWARLATMHTRAASGSNPRSPRPAALDFANGNADAITT